MFDGAVKLKATSVGSHQYLKTVLVLSLSLPLCQARRFVFLSLFFCFVFIVLVVSYIFLLSPSSCQPSCCRLLLATFFSILINSDNLLLNANAVDSRPALVTFAAPLSVIRPLLKINWSTMTDREAKCPCIFSLLCLSFSAQPTVGDPVHELRFSKICKASRPNSSIFHIVFIQIPSGSPQQHLLQT